MPDASDRHDQAINRDKHGCERMDTSQVILPGSDVEFRVSSFNFQAVYYSLDHTGNLLLTCQGYISVGKIASSLSEPV